MQAPSQFLMLYQPAYGQISSVFPRTRTACNIIGCLPKKSFIFERIAEIIQGRYQEDLPYGHQCSSIWSRDTPATDDPTHSTCYFPTYCSICSPVPCLTIPSPLIRITSARSGPETINPPNWCSISGIL